MFLFSNSRQVLQDLKRSCLNRSQWVEKHVHQVPAKSFYLRYESYTLILYKELGSSIFQSCQSGIGNTCPDLHFVQYIKA